MKTKLHSVICGAICITALPAGVSLAQCDPPGANTKCWDNDSGDGLWSTQINWNPNLLPLSTDEVYHLGDGAITVDATTAAEVNSFTFDPSESMTIDGSPEVNGAFTALSPPASGRYDLTVSPGASLRVEGDLLYTDATLPAVTVGNRTLVEVLGDIRGFDENNRGCVGLGG